MTGVVKLSRLSVEAALIFATTRGDARLSAFVTPGAESASEATTLTPYRPSDSVSDGRLGETFVDIQQAVGDFDSYPT
jgi:hypothetical protein